MHIRREARSSRSCEQIYALVRNINEYQDFIPWCRRSEVHREEGDRAWATLDVAYGLVSLSFTTMNRMRPYESITMELQEGTKQLRSLWGEWAFVPQAGGGCRIVLSLDLQFAHGMFARAFRPLFEHIGTTLVRAFVRRAEEMNK